MKAKYTLAYRIVFLFVSFTLFNSCSKEFLEQPPQDELTTGTYWTSEAQANSAVSSIYNAFARLSGYNVGFISFGDIAADDLSSTDVAWFVDIDQYQIKSTDIMIDGKLDHTVGAWGVFYAAIFRANWVLENIDKTTDITEKALVRGKNEARFLRAFAFFSLVNLFGDVPFFDHSLGADESLTIPRTASAEIYKFIENELCTAAGIDLNGNEIGGGLPLKGEYKLGSATKEAALGLLSRVYLYQSKFPEAERTARKLIDLGTCELQDDFGANWDNLMKNGKESIFEMQYRSNVKGGSWEENPGCGISDFTAPLNWNPTSLQGWGGSIWPVSNVASIFEHVVDGVDYIDGVADTIRIYTDKRREMSFFMAGDKYEYAPEGLQWYLPNDFTGISLAKYIKRNHFSEPAEQRMSTTYFDSDMNIPVIRYAEILLIYAEACYKNGKDTEALNYLNKIRQRAGLELYVNTDNFMNRLMQERRVEFIGEGQRFFDLRRWGKLEEVLGPLGYRSATKGLFPLPQSELELNRNLRQNDGY
jgi:starch-binding outer membrane protein, SusD/RagB family